MRIGCCSTRCGHRGQHLTAWAGTLLTSSFNNEQYQRLLENKWMFVNVLVFFTIKCIILTNVIINMCDLNVWRTEAEESLVLVFKFKTSFTKMWFFTVKLENTFSFKCGLVSQFKQINYRSCKNPNDSMQKENRWVWMEENQSQDNRISSLFSSQTSRKLFQKYFSPSQMLIIY